MWRGADCCAASGRSGRTTPVAVKVTSRLSDARPRFLMSRGNQSITQDALTTCHTPVIRSIRAHGRRCRVKLSFLAQCWIKVRDGTYKLRDLFPPAVGSDTLTLSSPCTSTNFTFVVWALEEMLSDTNRARDFGDFGNFLKAKNFQFLHIFHVHFIWMN